MFRYVPVGETKYSSEQGNYVTYGICALSKNGTQIESKAFVPDVSPDLKLVISLSDLYTEKQLDPVHLKCVIEDFLSE